MPLHAVHCALCPSRALHSFRLPAEFLSNPHAPERCALALLCYDTQMLEGLWEAYDAGAEQVRQFVQGRGIPLRYVLHCGEVTSGEVTSVPLHLLRVLNREGVVGCTRALG